MTDKTAADMKDRKWVDRIRVIDVDSGGIVDAPVDSLGPPPDRFSVQDLVKTAEELAAIDEIEAAFNVFLCSFCGLPPVRFDPERIHVLSEAEFKAKVGGAHSGRFQGKSWFGHVYLWRGWPLWMFQAILAHELFHDISYAWFDIRTKPETTVDGLKLPSLLPRRMGMVLIDPSYRTLLPHFHGLNEGTTETAAMAIRQLVSRRSRLLDEAGRQTLMNFTVSPPLAAFTDRLVNTAVGGPDDAFATMKKLFLDCLQGTDNFLAQLEARLPGATERLRRTGARPDELLPAAEELGFADLAEAIRPYVAVPK